MGPTGRARAMTEPKADKIGASSDAAALPAGVSGSMDGERPPKNSLEQVQKVLQPYREKYSHYLGQMRPWREFCQWAEPEGDISKRLQSNLTYFQMNYALIFFVQMVIAIITNPKCVAVIVVLTLVWILFLKKNDDVTWELSVAGMPLGKTQRWMILSGITAIVLLCVVGQVLFSAAFFSTILLMCHGIAHPIPDSEYAAVADGVDSEEGNPML